MKVSPKMIFMSFGVSNPKSVSGNPGIFVRIRNKNINPIPIRKRIFIRDFINLEFSLGTNFTKISFRLVGLGDRCHLNKANHHDR